MTRLVQTVLLLIFFQGSLLAQATYTVALKPGAATGKDTWVYDRNGRRDQAYGKDPSLLLNAWTGNGRQFHTSAFLQFDLSILPRNAVIESARLHLYSDPSSNTGYGDGHHGNNNAFFIRRVTGPWREEATTFNQQPTVTSVGQVLVPGPTSKSQDFTDLNVTGLVQEMQRQGNYGFHLQLRGTHPYNCVALASSDHPEAGRHPKLVITYSSTNCGTFTTSEKNGQDANIFSRNPDRKSGLGQYLTTYAWTHHLRPSWKRSFLEFDLAEIPRAATITSANLYLYFSPGNQDMYGGHHGDNSLQLNPVTAYWNEAQITWNNQPAIDELLSFTVAATPSKQADFLGTDITRLIQHLQLEENTFGFSIRMAAPRHYKGVMLASGNHPEAAYHPVLQVCWEEAAATDRSSPPLIRLFPNPTEGHFTLDLTQIPPGKFSYRVIDVQGRERVSPTPIQGREVTPFNLSYLPRGVYVVACYLDGSLYTTNKVIIRQTIVRP